MRVVVTGARGLLGAAIVREFSGAHDVEALDRSHLDITDDRAIDAMMRSSKPDLVVNCAACNDVDGAQDAPELALRTNAFAVLALSRAVAAAGATLVHFSTDFVFDGETDRPYTEDDPPNPSSVYGASKLLGDWFALESPPVYVLRVESLFGPPGAPAARRGSLGTIVDKIRRGDDVPLFTDRTVSPSYTPDVALAARMLIDRRSHHGVYHCTNGGNATWLEIGERAASRLGLPMRARPVTLATVPLRAKRPRYCALSNAKLASAGIEMRSWQDALDDFLSRA